MTPFKDINLLSPPAASHSGTRPRRAFLLLAGLVILLLIGLSAYNAGREIRSLVSASSDNIQWSLAQAEVEFHEYENQIAAGPIDLAMLRNRFQIFHSRIISIQQASVYADLHDADVEALLTEIMIFVDASMVIFEADDAVLRDSLPQLQALSNYAHPVVRSLFNSAVEAFANTADLQRSAVTDAMAQLAVALGILIGSLALAAFYFYRLNSLMVKRDWKRHHTETRMKTVIGTSLDGVIISDFHGKILEFNPAAEAIFGYRAEDVRGKDIGQIIVPGHLLDLHNAGMQRMRAKGEKRVVGKGRVQLEASRSSGEIFPIELAIQSAVTDDGEIFIAFLRDISVRMANQAELVAARDKAMAGEKLKTDFLATMSHEIRTPLNGLLGNMNLLRDTQLSPDQDRHIGYMETSGRLLMSQISDVLDIARYDAGKRSTKSEPMDISALIQDIIDSQRSAVSLSETALKWRWEGAPVNWINSDYDRLQHVMINLIGNAVKFTQRGTIWVTLQVEVQGASVYLRIDVKDTGRGIPEELAAHIFDDFVTGSTAYDRDVGGTGLGLSIVKRFVAALNGTIEVTSVLGKGSTFTVKMPITQAQEPDPGERPTLQFKKTEALKILLVEDNEINRIVARRMLETDGHTVTVATDGLESVAHANATAFDLILMDISMPLMDGRTATLAIRQSGGASSNSTIIALTANAIAVEQEGFITGGMDGVLTKPFSREALRGLLADQCEKFVASTESLVDQTLIAETRQSIGEGPFINLRKDFVFEVDDFIRWAGSDVPIDYLVIADRSHKVAGSAAVFGAVMLRISLQEIEVAAHKGDHQEIIRIVSNLNVLWTDTKAAMMEAAV